MLPPGRVDKQVALRKTVNRLYSVVVKHAAIGKSAGAEVEHCPAGSAGQTLWDVYCTEPAGIATPPGRVINKDSSRRVPLPSQGT